MLRFYAQFFVGSASTITGLENAGMGIVDLPTWAIIVQQSLGQLRKECMSVNLEHMVGRIDRITQRLSRDESLGVLVSVTTGRQYFRTYCILLQELRKDLYQELSSKLFVCLPDRNKQWYAEDDSPLFGEAVASKFPHSTFHIAEAGRCFALERWGGCVHHLMLATEIALRGWGRCFPRTKKTPIGLVDWKPILDAAKTELDRLRNSPKTNVMDKRVQRLAEQLSHFGFIKDAYRNHIAHGREKYDERRSKNLLNHVMAFMQSLV